MYSVTGHIAQMPNEEGNGMYRERSGLHGLVRSVLGR